jgi:hypothetical protein
MDEDAYNAAQLDRQEWEVAAAVRQYQRACEAGDDPAKEVETEAICDRVCRLLYHHLDLRLGMSSDDWVWLNGSYECRIEQMSTLEIRASGRVECSLPEGQRRWSEPFDARISHSPTAAVLQAYTIWLGNRATFLNVPEVRRMIESGEVLTPPAPVHQDGWAFVFHLGDRD